MDQSAGARPPARENTPLLSVHVPDSTAPPSASSSSYGGGGTFLSSITPRSARAGYDADGFPLPSPFSPHAAVFRLYPARWYVLALFSTMALANNAICYTVGSVHRVARRYYYGGHGHMDNDEATYDLAQLVSCYFLTYCLFSFPTSWFIERFGLKAGVLTGAWLQVVGCLVRVWATPAVTVPEDGSPVEDHAHGDLWWLLVGQVVASLGQAFFVNPPPLLAAVWFGVDERTLATTIACNANTLGIAVAYMLGPALVDSVDDLPAYMMVCLIAVLVCAILATVYFPSAPPTPPSHSQVEPTTFPKSPEPVEDSISPEVLTAVLVPAANPSSSDSDLEEDDDEEAELDSAHSNHAAAQGHSHVHSAECNGGGGSHGHSHSEPNGLGAEGAHRPRHVRVQSLSELAIANSYSTMQSPPCSFVRKEAILAERARSKNASRILASARMFKKMFQAPGFIHTLMVFGISEATINGFAAFMFMIMEPWGYHSMQMVGGVVCAFIGMCMVGSAVIGWLVDKNKAFKLWLVVSLVASAASLLYLQALGPVSIVHIWVSMCLFGFWMGPVQPLSIETAVEVTYPAPESSVTAVQQVLGNLFSAALFPLILLCRNPVTKSMQPALCLILLCLLGTGLFYLTFDGEYRRLAHEKKREEDHRALHKKLHDEAHRARIRSLQQSRAEALAAAKAREAETVAE